MAGNQYATQLDDWYIFAQACINSGPCAAIYTFAFRDDVRSLLNFVRVTHL